MILKDWMVRNLEQFGNCAIGENFIKQHGKNKIVEEVKALGYSNARIISNVVKLNYGGSKPSKTVFSHIETKDEIPDNNPKIVVKKGKKKRNRRNCGMFKIDDEVRVIKGLHKGSEGKIVNLSVNDFGTITYEIYVEALFDRIGTISKKEGDLEFMKRRAGRPKKINLSSTDNQLKSIDNQPESIDNQAESIDKPSQELVELTKEIVEAEYQEEPKEAEKSSYELLIESYDNMRRRLNVAELEAFYDIVAKDVLDSKYVLEQMYQMNIENLMKIRKELQQ